jgi:D-arabinose 1-dehydrogenase-like Zn-dependent alcohol dehydrogenase
VSVQTMRAARLHEVGGAFQIDEMEIPSPQGSDVLVRVRACALVPNLRNVITHYPIWFPSLPLPRLPAIYGLDAAGEIAALGPDVIGLDIGQRVYVNPLRFCGTCARCRTDHSNDCESLILQGYFGASANGQAMFDRYPWGGLAEYMIAPGSAMVTLSDATTYHTASRFGYLGTSYAALRRAEAGPDSTVLVYGATGTLGVGAILVCLALGVPKILAVGRNRELLKRLRALSPERIDTYSTSDGPAEPWVRTKTAGIGADLVVETLAPETAPETMQDLYACTARLGSIVTIGGAMKTVPFDPQWIMANGIRYFGSGWFKTAEAQSMSDLVGAGIIDLSPIENNVFELDKVNDALEFVCNRAAGGLCNVVVEP